MKTPIFTSIIALGFALVSYGQTYTFNPSADAFVSASNPNNNYGAAGTIAVSAGTSGTNGVFDSVMQFNLASTAGANVQAMTLQLTTGTNMNALFNPNAAGQFSIIWMQNSSWTEGSGTPMTSSTNGGITYNSLPTFLSGSDESLGTFNFSAETTGSSQTYSLSLPAGFLSTVESGDNVSLELVPADSSVSFLANSRSFGTVPARPLLTITAVPEPAELALAGASLLLAAGHVRRRWLRKA